MAKRPNWRNVKIHRSYTVEEAAQLLGVAKGTVLRWVKSGDLPALKEQKPFLILGSDLQAYLKGRKRDKQTCGPAECYCFTCRAPRNAAGRMADFWPVTAKTGNLQALCASCGGLMHKTVSLARLPALELLLEITNRQAPPRIGKCDAPSLNDDL
jgi:excisionase family DNA binding protein